ncbi:MAG: PilZ domain-containing protein [Gammaproteobacteria bacterium]|nr:PilZ domain-containing protein [Gammaproteobacteria bacterium]
MGHEDRREYERIPLAINAQLDMDKNESHEVRSRNFSAGGAFLASDNGAIHSLAVGDTGYLTISVHTEFGQESETVQIQVVRCSDDGVAVRFLARDAVAKSA